MSFLRFFFSSFFLFFRENKVDISCESYAYSHEMPVLFSLKKIECRLLKVCLALLELINIHLRLTTLKLNFRRHLSSAFYFNKSLGKTFICKVVRLNVKQRRSR